MMQLRASLQSPDSQLSSPVHLDDDGHTQKDFTHSEPVGEMTFLKTSFSPAGSLLRPPVVSVMGLPLCLATPSPSPLFLDPPTPTLNKPPTPKPLSQAPPRGNLRLWDCHKTILMGSGPAPDKGGMGPQVCGQPREGPAITRESCVSPCPSHPTYLSFRQARQQDFPRLVTADCGPMTRHQGREHLQGRRGGRTGILTGLGVGEVGDWGSTMCWEQMGLAGYQR